MTSGWAALVKAALLGTERTGRPDVSAAGQVGLLVADLGGIDERSTEQVLLATAAAVATANRAGRQPERPAADPPAPAPPVERSPAGDDAARTLAALLAGTARQLLPEWLETCGASGRRVPSVLLPAVLDTATSSRLLRPAVVAALGERGRWLAAQRPEWRWAVGAEVGELPADPARAWSEGTGVERRALLTAARAHDPDLGRELVLSTWTSDRADDRAAFVELLATGLSMADEPFLEERALVDRGQAVRRAAAEMLSRLPGSRLAARMQVRAGGLVAAGPGELSVRLPDDLPAEWEADGIARLARRGTGERAWWLTQAVAAAPLDSWGDATGAVPGAARSDHGEPVLRGWAAATVRQGRQDWALALLSNPATPGSLPPEAAALLHVLPPPDRGAWLAAAIAGAPRREAPYLAVVGEVPRPWPPSLVRSVAGRAAASLLASVPAAHVARPALLHLAERADPATLPRLIADLSEVMRADGRLDAELRRPLALLQLRHDMLAELAGPASPS